VAHQIETLHSGREERESMQGRKGESGGIGLRNALAGLAVLHWSQKNARVHAAATVAVIVTGFVLRLSVRDWIFIGLAVGLVWLAEAVNTAIELVADAAVPQEHPLVGKAKDVAAGGVLLAAATAAFIGILVLGPPLVRVIADTH
jgi:diacylglycerol kinase (ATP)